MEQNTIPETTEFQSEISDNLAAQIGSINLAQYLKTMKEIKLSPPELKKSVFLADSQSKASTTLNIINQNNIQINTNSISQIKADQTLNSVATLNFRPEAEQPAKPIPIITDLAQPFEIRCKQLRGQIFFNKLGNGSSGKCIKVLYSKDPDLLHAVFPSLQSQELLTPREFELKAGLKGGDWKRSIFCYQSKYKLIDILTENKIQTHAKKCPCIICTDGLDNKPIKFAVPIQRVKKSVPIIGQVADENLAVTENLPILPVKRKSLEPLRQEKELQLVETVAPIEVKKPKFSLPNFATLNPSIVISEPEISSNPASNSSTKSVLRGLVSDQISSYQNSLQKVADKIQQTQNLLSNPICRDELIDNFLDSISDGSQAITATLDKLLGFELPNLPGNFSNSQNLLTVPAIDPVQQLSFENLSEKLSNSSSSLEIQLPCCVCGKVARTECSRCHNALYCSLQCQKLDWKVNNHKLKCKPS